MEKNTILIVGLGQIGTSIGLALQAHSDRLLRVGHTRQYGNANHAKKLGAIDKVAINLPSAARKADIVLLALPMDQVESTLKLISEDLKQGAVVLDTSPSRSTALQWAQKNLQEEQHYLGFTPVLNPAKLHEAKSGIESASDVLFQKGIIVITAADNCSSDALKLASDLASLIRAMPMFANAVEIDSYMAAMHILPQLLGAGLSNITADSPGWGELRKLAGRPYAQATSLIDNIDNPEGVALSARLDKKNVLRSLNEMIAELSSMRDELANNDTEQFEARITQAGEKRRKWWIDRQVSTWLNERGADVDLSGVDASFGQLFVGVKTRKKRGKQIKN